MYMTEDVHTIHMVIISNVIDITYICVHVLTYAYIYIYIYANINSLNVIKIHV